PRRHLRVEVGEPPGAAFLALDRLLELAPLLGVVGPVREGHQVGAGGAGEAHQRRVHSVERGPRHEPDRQRGPLHHAPATAGGSEQVRNTVLAPRAWARPSAARTNGVVPLAAMPTTVSFDPTRRASISAMAALGSSSAPSTDLSSAGVPPAMIPTTISGGVP